LLVVVVAPPDAVVVDVVDVVLAFAGLSSWWSCSAT